MFQYVAHYNERMQALFPLGHGRPIYNDREPLYFGDVGVVRNGAFIKLFNATLPRYHPEQGRVQFREARRKEMELGKSHEPFLPESFKPFKVHPELEKFHSSAGNPVHGVSDLDQYPCISSSHYLDLCTCGKAGQDFVHHLLDCGRAVQWVESTQNEDDVYVHDYSNLNLKE